MKRSKVQCAATHYNLLQYGACNGVKCTPYKGDSHNSPCRGCARLYMWQPVSDQSNAYAGELLDVFCRRAV
jgi:hypothetical protein